MRIRHLRSALAAALVAAVLAAAAPAGAAAEGTMTWGVHVSLTPAFFDPADATGHGPAAHGLLRASTTRSCARCRARRWATPSPSRGR